MDPGIIQRYVSKLLEKLNDDKEVYSFTGLNGTLFGISKEIGHDLRRNELPELLDGLFDSGTFAVVDGVMKPKYNDI